MNVKIMGADQSITNVSGNNYVATLQVATQRTRLYKLTFSPLSGMAAAVYAWVFNTASGSGSSAAPVAVVPIAIGAIAILEFSADASLFTSGVYVALSTVLPTDATTTVTTSGSNKMIIKADYRTL
jgi:hypothetical protein